MKDRAGAEETLDPDDWDAMAALGRRMVDDLVAQPGPYGRGRPGGTPLRP